MGIGGFFFVAGVLLVVLSTGRSITAPFGFLGVGEIRAGGEAASTLRLMGLIWAGVGLLNLIIHPIAKRVTVGGHFTAVDPATVLPDPPPAGVAHSLATLAELAQRGLLDAQEWSAPRTSSSASRKTVRPPTLDSSACCTTSTAVAASPSQSSTPRSGRSSAPASPDLPLPSLSPPSPTPTPSIDATCDRTHPIRVPIVAGSTFWGGLAQARVQTLPLV